MVEQQLKLFKDNHSHEILLHYLFQNKTVIMRPVKLELLRLRTLPHTLRRDRRLLTMLLKNDNKFLCCLDEALLEPSIGSIYNRMVKLSWLRRAVPRIAKLVMMHAQNRYQVVKASEWNYMISTKNK